MGAPNYKDMIDQLAEHFKKIPHKSSEMKARLGFEKSRPHLERTLWDFRGKTSSRRRCK